MQTRTPPLYATGQWRLKAPYQVENGAVYTCKAINTMDALEMRGVDTYKEFYEPLGIDFDVYWEDVRRLASIVTLMSDTHPTVYVPDTYIRSYPDVTTVPYRHMVLSVSLGAVPDTLALDDLKHRIKEYALASLGLDVQIKEHQAGHIAQGVDQQAHQVYENNRRAKLEANTTDYATLKKNELELEQLRQFNEVLSNLCVSAGLLE